jgi:hypothetical protein
MPLPNVPIRLRNGRTRAVTLTYHADPRRTRGLISAGYPGGIRAVRLPVVSVGMSALLPWSADPHGDFAGRVPTRGGRDVHLMCRRTGRLTVLLVAGLPNRADTGSTRADEGERGTILQPDQPGHARAAIKRVVRAVRAGKRTTGQLVASRW